MIVDFNVETDRLSSSIYDVAIAGGGPAGITLALALARAGRKVAIVEGGGLALEPESQAMYDGTTSGVPYAGLGSRLRYLGGSSNHWTGRCGWFDEVDFEQRPHRPLPGWPISRAEAYRFADHAARVLDLPQFPFRPASDRSLSHFRPTEVAYSPPTRFLTKYRAALQNTPRLDCFLHANLVDIDTTPAGNHVTAFTVRNYNGRIARLRAQRFVICQGGIENARILLNARKTVRNGIGNHSNLVGRCFMEHLDVNMGRFVTTDAAFWRRGPVGLNPNLALIREYDLNNGVVALTPSARPRDFGRAAGLRRLLRSSACHVGPTLARKLIDFDCPGDGIVTSMIEQQPNPSSRITLNRERDAMGLQRVNLDWELSAQDYRSIDILAFELAKDLATANVARLQIAPGIRNKTITDYGLHSHHMGTTRMSADPRYGVVDPDQKVHGIDNLYIGGSSVFPTGGGINPTFTIVALTLRLSDHLLSKPA